MEAVHQALRSWRRLIPWLRPSLLTALLIGELLFLTLRYDTQPLYANTGWWAWPISHARIIPQLAVAAAAGTLVVGGRRLLQFLNTTALERTFHGLTYRHLSLIAHFGAFAIFAALTENICKASAPLTGAQASAWLVAALAVLLTWGGALFPPAQWRLLLYQQGTALLLGGISGILAWAAAAWTAEQWGALGAVTIQLVADCLRCAGYATAVDLEHHIVGTAGFRVAVSAACCGYEGVGLFWVFYALHLVYSHRRLRFPAVLLLLPLGTIALLAVNILRITLLIALGDAGFAELAVDGFHSQAGWIGFNMVALGIVALTSHVSFFRRHSELEADASPRPLVTVGALLNPFLIIVALAMLARALTTAPEIFYPLRVIGVALMLIGYRKQYRRLRWSVSGEALAAGLAGALVWITLVKPGPGEGDSLAVEPLLNASGVGWLIFRVVGSTVTVPLAEELAFRGYLLSRLSKFMAKSFQRGVPWSAIALSSLLFGLMHGNWLAGSSAGAFYAFVFLRRRSLGDAVAAHATTNALLAVYASATGQWWLWS